MTGEEIVEKVIDSSVKRLEKQIEARWGEEARANFKENIINELRREGEQLKEILKIHTPDGFRLLDLMNQGGMVFTKIVKQKEHGFYSPRARDLVQHLANYLPNEPAFKDARVTIIIEPIEEVTSNER